MIHYEKPLGESEMERNGTPVSTAIKRKLHFINRKAEGAWHSEWQALYDQIDPANLGTVRTQIETFVAVTIQLVKRKAESMIATTREVLSKIEVDENLQVELKNFILKFFDDLAYIERWTRFLEGVERKFKSQMRGQIFILYFLKLLLRRREENLVKNKDSTPGLSCYSLNNVLGSKR